MTDHTTLKGADAKLYVIAETTPNITPDAGDWILVEALKSFSPTANKNVQPLTSAGSKRLIGFNKTGVLDVNWNVQMQPKGQAWLTFLSRAFGDWQGTTECRLPTLSIMAVWDRECTGEEYEYAELYNGCVIENFTLTREVGNNPVNLAIAGRAQNVQTTHSFTADKPVFTGHQNITIGTLGTALGADVAPMMYYHWEELLKYEGGSEAQLPRIGTWTMTITNSLVPIPTSKIVGADAVRRALWMGFGTEGQTLEVSFNIVPENFDYFIDYLADDFIETLKLNFTAPTGWPASNNRQITFNSGDWMTPSNISITELATASQALMAQFQSTVITAV